MLISRSASGVPGMDIGFQKFVGRFTGIGMRVGMLIRQRYVLMFSTCSKMRRANSARQPAPGVDLAASRAPAARRGGAGRKAEGHDSQTRQSGTARGGQCAVLRV